MESKTINLLGIYNYNNIYKNNDINKSEIYFIKKSIYV
jgi:hypothetical protein